MDHELNNKELAVRILGLVHMANLYDEIGCPSFEVEDDLRHAAFVLAESLLIDEY